MVEKSNVGKKTRNITLFISFSIFSQRIFRLRITYPRAIFANKGKRTEKAVENIMLGLYYSWS